MAGHRLFERPVAYCTVIAMNAEIRPTHRPDPESVPGIAMPVPAALVDMPDVPIPVNS